MNNAEAQKAILNAERQRVMLNQAITDAIRERGTYADDIRHFTRNRKLSCETIVRFLLTAQGGPLSRELYEAGFEVVPSSFVERRKALGYRCFHELMLHYNSLCDDSATIKGKFRLYCIDGSTVPLPRNESSRNHYKSDTNPKGWNNTHANLLLDILNGVFLDCYLGEGAGDSRKAHDEQGALYSLIYKRRFDQPTILLLDRGYEGYNTLMHLQNIPNLYFISRVKNDGLRPVRELPPEEEVWKSINWLVSTKQDNISKSKNAIYIPTGSPKGNSPKTRVTRWDFGDGMFPMQCNVARIMLDTGQYETLLTNLPISEFTLADLKELYAKRWKIETNIRFWKYAIGALALHSRTDALILQELYSHLIMFNFCFRVCREIEIPQKPGNKYAYAIDRTMAIYLCRRFFWEPDFTGEKLIRNIKRYVQPVRPNRSDERNLVAKTFPGFSYRIPS